MPYVPAPVIEKLGAKGGLLVQPNYSEYSNLELQEAIDSIDKIKHPERYRNLKLEIESRNGAVESDALKAKQTNKDLWVTIACIFFVIPLLSFMGIDAMTSGEFTLKRHTFTREEHPIFFCAYVMFCFATVLFLIFGLFKRSRNGT